MRRMYIVIALSLVAWCVSAETLTMDAQRDDPEFFALFVKTYKDAGIDLIIDVLPPLRCVANVKSGDMVGYLFSDYAIADFSRIRMSFVSDSLPIRFIAEREWPGFAHRRSINGESALNGQVPA